jgi:hypothetical protein
MSGHDGFDDISVAAAGCSFFFGMLVAVWTDNPIF